MTHADLYTLEEWFKKAGHTDTQAVNVHVIRGPDKSLSELLNEADAIAAEAKKLEAMAAGRGLTREEHYDLQMRSKLLNASGVVRSIQGEFEPDDFYLAYAYVDALKGLEPRPQYLVRRKATRQVAGWKRLVDWTKEAHKVVTAALKAHRFPPSAAETPLCFQGNRVSWALFTDEKSRPCDQLHIFFYVPDMGSA